MLPGDNVTKHIISLRDQKPSNKTAQDRYQTFLQTKIGTGIRFDKASEQFFVTSAGRLERTKTGKNGIFYVQQNIQKRYRPHVEDRVVGIIEERVGSDGVGGDLFRVNIQASHPAILSNLSFEGASKRNKPSFQVGQILYARVIASPAVSENTNAKFHNTQDLCFDPITLSCINGPHDGNLPRKDWMTSEGAYGELRGGTVCSIPLPLARELLKPSCIVLEELGKHKTLQFELAVGVNGLLWIHSTRPEYTIMIQNAIQNSAVTTPAQVRSMVKSLVYNTEKQIQTAMEAIG